MGVLSWLVSSLFSLIVKIFFRQTVAFGVEKIPPTGAVIFVCGPHNNQFLDPLIITHHAPRTNVGFLSAQKSMDRKWVGKIIKASGAIGVVRPQDIMVKKKGTVTVTGKIVTGTGTSFTTDFPAGSSICFGSTQEAVAVANVVSDTQLELACACEQPVTGSTTIKMVPKVDQSQVYEKVWHELNQGRAIGIFPEGGSHDRASLLPIKAGVTLMALGAMNKYPGLDVKIVPAGLTYFAAHRFRSRAFVEFGDPISISPDLVAKYAKGGRDKRDACTDLLSEIISGLRSVTISADSPDTLQLIRALRSMYRLGSVPEMSYLISAFTPQQQQPPQHHIEIDEKDSHDDGSEPYIVRGTSRQTKKFTSAKVQKAEQQVQLERRMAQALAMTKNQPDVQEMMQALSTFYEQLTDQGISESQVDHLTESSSCLTFIRLIWRIITLIWMSIVSIPGLLLNLPVGIIARHVSAKKAIEAKNSSTVKIAGRDVLATWKVMVAGVTIPGFLLLYVAAAAIIVNVWSPSLHIGIRIGVPLGVLFILPILAYTSVIFMETGAVLMRSLRPLAWRLCCQARTRTLREQKESIVAMFVALTKKYGPLIFDASGKPTVPLDEDGNPIVDPTNKLSTGINSNTKVDVVQVQPQIQSSPVLSSTPRLSVAVQPASVEMTLPGMTATNDGPSPHSKQDLIHPTHIDSTISPTASPAAGGNRVSDT